MGGTQVICTQGINSLSLISFTGKPPHHPFHTPEAEGSGEAPDVCLEQWQPCLTTQVTVLYLINFFLINFLLIAQILHFHNRNFRIQ